MRQLVLAIPLSIGLAGEAIAADVSDYDPIRPPPELYKSEPGWEASLFVYGWMTSLNGQAGIAPFPPIDINISFEEFFENLEMVAAGFGEIRYGRFGVAADVFFADIADGITILNLGAIQLKMGGDIGIATLMGEYRIWEQQKSHIDLMAGARLWYFKDEVEVIFGGSQGFIGEKYTWVDPMIGTKVRVQGDAPLFFEGWGMIGGFGTASKIDWDVFGSLGYEFNNHMSVLAGYRVIGVDYEGDGLTFDVNTHGPIVGALFAF